jgi:3-hydroxypropanoate dehydrogenase
LTKDELVSSVVNHTAEWVSLGPQINRSADARVFQGRGTGVADIAEQVSPVLEHLDERGRATLFTDARTANTFTSTPVSDRELAEIWTLAKWGPTSANTQPLRVLFVRPGAERERLVRHMYDRNQAKVGSAPAVAVLAWDTRYHHYVPEILPFRPELKDMFEADAELRTEAGKFNATLQAGYFILSVRAHGLAAGPMSGFDADGVNADFFPDGRWKSLLVVNIGHPAEGAWAARLPRLGDSDVIKWV